ncbi:MAG: hypothetical protein ACE5KM_06270 [Planctomycetaceae bacterium]
MSAVRNVENSLLQRSSRSLHDETSFTDEEREQFDQDDEQAGRTLGKILCTLFVYTAVVMSFIIWWTFQTVGR